MLHTSVTQSIQPATARGDVGIQPRRLDGAAPLLAECPRSFPLGRFRALGRGRRAHMVSAGSGNLTDSCGGDGSSGEGGLGEVLAGVAIAVVASVGINIGNNVQVLAGPRCIRSQGGLGWPGIGVRVRVRGGLRLQGFASTAAQPAHQRALPPGRVLIRDRERHHQASLVHRACAGAGAQDAHRSKGDGGEEARQARRLQAWRWRHEARRDHQRG